MTLMCYCCGEAYERGQYRCCAPPKNMSSHAWLARHCKQCVPNNPHGSRSHCPRHCTCPKAPVLGSDGFSAFRDTSLVAELERKRKLTF
jgi:hypothetical protein